MIFFPEEISYILSSQSKHTLSLPQTKSAPFSPSLSCCHIFALRQNCLSTQRVAPFVTFTPARLASAHSFLSFSPCIELCLSGRPGGRTTQRLLHLPPSSPIYNNQNETSRPLCAHSDSGPCFFSVSFTPHPCLLTPLVMSCFSSPPPVPTASETNSQTFTSFS